jgi:hypothetical protein
MLGLIVAITTTVTLLVSLAGSAGAASGTHVPIGAYDTLGYTDSAPGFKVTGWCYDADAPSIPCDVHIYVDGVLFRGLNAGSPRPDVAAALRTPYQNHGFVGEYPYTTPGPHSVCVYGIDLAGPGKNPLLGCKVITFPGLMRGTYYFTRAQTSVIVSGGVGGIAAGATALTIASGGATAVAIGAISAAVGTLGQVLADRGVCLWVSVSSHSAGAYSCRSGPSV